MKIILPTTVALKKGIFRLNMNAYRNANHYTLSEAKIKYQEIVAPLVQHLPKLNQISLSYELFAGSARRMDVSNGCAIVDKFFSDSLVNLGYLPDDDYKHLLGVQYLFGSIDKGNPRVEVTIHPI